MVQQIVEGCGGRVEAESQVGRGSCFRVWLPQAAETAAVGNGREAAVENGV